MRTRTCAVPGLLDRKSPAQAILCLCENGRGMEVLAFDSRPMDFHSFMIYVRNAFPDLPGWHWGVMALVAGVAAIMLKKRKGLSTYSACALAITAFFGFFLMDGMVVNRLGAGQLPHCELNLKKEIHNLIESIGARTLMLFNLAVFIPFGAAFSEFFSASQSLSVKRNLGIVALTAFCFSLFVECMQRLFKVGVFELTDMVLNTLGAIIGAALALSIRKMLCR